MTTWILVRGQIRELTRNLLMLQSPLMVIGLAILFDVVSGNDQEVRQMFLGTLLVMSALFVGWMTVALALGEEKEKGVLEAVLMTPAKPWEIIGAKLIVGAGLSLLCAALATAIFSEMPQRPLLLVATFGMALLFSLACGLAVATVSPDQKSASGTTVALSLLIFFTGFPIFEEVAPAVWKVAAYLPARPMFELLRAGVTNYQTDLWQHFGVLTAYTTAALAICVRFLRRQASER